MRTVAVVASAIVLAVLSACGGSKPAPPVTASPSAADDAGAVAAVTSTEPAAPSSNGSGAIVATTGQAPAVVADAGAAPAGSEHAFAKDSAEAESMIDEAIDSRHNEMEKCAAEARKRWNEPRMKISLLVGIDQEGHLLGVKRPTKKDKKDDDQLLACVRVALKGAPFPKSHAGVITIKKTYEEAVAGSSP